MPSVVQCLHQRGSFERAAALLVLAFLAVRLVMSAVMPLIADEAYAVVVTRFPTLSYFDHPPLGFDFARLSAWLFGSEAPFAVRLPHVLMGSLTAWLIFLVTRRAFGARAGFWAVAAYSTAPFFFVSAAHFVVPDGPLNLFLLVTLWLVLPDLLEDRPGRAGRWLLAGLALGAALLSKYTAVLFGLGAFLILATSPRGRRLLATPWPWLSGAIALACLTPVLVWNARNGWVSLGFQSGRAFGGTLHPLTFLEIQFGQALFLLPWIWAPAVWMVWRGLFRPQAPAERVFAILAAVPIALFDAVSIFGGEQLAHWAMPGFLLAFPLVGLWCADVAPRALRIGLAGSAGLVSAAALIATLQAGSGFVTRALHLPPRPGFDWTILSWDALAGDFARRGILADGDSYLVPVSWLVGGKAGHALGPDLPIAPPVWDPRQFAFMDDPRLAARTKGYAMIAAWPGETEAARVELTRLIAAAGGYRLTGEPWVVTETRGGEAVFEVLVQPVVRD
ncbi:MAG: glycosyltransferase family 39 protein [Rhizobiales bacterium]|nr:glycosyltransferase family 39 protein [Hyphomicrobiales bacterium]